MICLRVTSIAAALALGCGSKSARDKVASVSGRVTYAGQPVTEGRILFYPEDGRRMAMSAIGYGSLAFLDEGRLGVMLFCSVMCGTGSGSGRLFAASSSSPIPRPRRRARTH